MIDNYLTIDSFEKCIKESINNIKIGNLNEAIEYIHEAMLQDDSSPKSHNLLGIIYEMRGELDLARKHYRASYSLDPTFKASSINLERISSFSYKFNIENIKYGYESLTPEKYYYKIVYDEKNIGRIKRL